MKKTLSLFLIIISIAVTGCSAFQSTPDYLQPIDTFIEVVNGNAKKVKDLAPERFWNYAEKHYQWDVDYINGTTDEFLKNLIGDYGKGVNISYEIVYTDTVDELVLDKIAKELKEDYDIPTVSVTEAYEVKLDLIFRVRGQGLQKPYEDTWFITKIDNKWYPVNSNGKLLLTEYIY